MQFNNKIPSEKENRLTAFINGEPDIPDISTLEAEEIADFTSVWKATGTNFVYSATNPDQTWRNLQQEMAKSDDVLKKNIFKSPVFKYAAMIVMVIGIGFITYQAIHKPLAEPVRMTVAKTDAHPLNLTIITLPDGSMVKMNANTKIEYPERFAANIRKVRLSGEAFFTVTRDAAHPFIIDTENAVVEVLGTSFNVSDYPLSGLVEVNVETGKVKLTQHAGNTTSCKSAILPAGERGWLKVVDGGMGHAKTLAPNYASWITKEIIFQRTPLAEAFSVLENTYHVKIRTENPEIGKIPYTANFADLKLDYIVDVIARTHHLKVKRNGDEIIFTRIVN